MSRPTALDARITEEDVAALFRAMLRRDPDDPNHTANLVAAGLSVRDLVVGLRGCDELRNQVSREALLHDDSSRRDPHFYRCPPDLAVPDLAVPDLAVPDLAVSDTVGRRVLLVGSCMMHSWEQALLQMAPPCLSELYLTGGELPALPVRPMGEYDCQIVHLPLRSVMPDAVFARLAQDDIEGHERLFAHGVGVIRSLLPMAMRWNREHGLLSFVLPFVVPQQNPAGRLLPRYDLRNLVFFVEKLNEALAGELAAYANAYFFDLNEVLATHGRRFSQEDAVALTNHGAFLADFNYDQDGDRLDKPRRLGEVYEVRVTPAIVAAFRELQAMMRTLRQADMVKLVVVDLDDTLWRGVVAEMDLDALPTSEGWPVSLWEALAFLKRRGVLLGIISQNDEARVMQAWERIFGHRLRPEDFALRKIDWRPKPIKMAETLEAVNLLAESVVYIDDNPLQRAEMAAAYPAMRILGGDPYLWRHILLWAPETQTAAISAESGRRTEMVRAQVAREGQRQVLSRAEFLGSLNVRMNLFRVSDMADPRLGRILELINKTNQFNTTGERTDLAACSAWFAEDVCIHAFELADAYTDYGLVGAMIVGPVRIRQFVMSCRVMGLDAELAAVAQMVALFRAQGRDTIIGTVVETERNLPCRNLYQRCGFALGALGWTRSTREPPALPAHITLTAAAG